MADDIAGQLLGREDRSSWCGDVDPTDRFACQRIRDHALDLHACRNDAGGIHQWKAASTGDHADYPVGTILVDPPTGRWAIRFTPGDDTGKGQHVWLAPAGVIADGTRILHHVEVRGWEVAEARRWGRLADDKPPVDGDLRARCITALSEQVSEFISPNEFGGYVPHYGELVDIVLDVVQPEAARADRDAARRERDEMREQRDMVKVELGFERAKVEGAQAAAERWMRAADRPAVPAAGCASWSDCMQHEDFTGKFAQVITGGEGSQVSVRIGSQYYPVIAVEQAENEWTGEESVAIVAGIPAPVSGSDTTVSGCPACATGGEHTFGGIGQFHASSAAVLGEAAEAAKAAGSDTTADGSEYCAVEIWPSWANGWVRCGSGFGADGRCQYGHRRPVSSGTADDTTPDGGDRHD